MRQFAPIALHLASSSSPDLLLKRRGQLSTNCRGCDCTTYCKLPVPNLILLSFPCLSPLVFANPPGPSGFAACPLRSSTDTLIARLFLKFACCVSAYYVRPPWQPKGGNRNRTPGSVSLRCSIAHPRWHCNGGYEQGISWNSQETVASCLHRLCL
jgi:hypothetical protein